jgi:murein L,D-transpeptidase YafK
VRRIFAYRRAAPRYFALNWDPRPGSVNLGFAKVASFDRRVAIYVNMSTQPATYADSRPTGRAGILAHCTYRLQLLALGVVLSLGFTGRSFAQSMQQGPLADTILVVKHERKLYLLHDNNPIRSYRIALGLSPTGAKQRQWDFRTPEGNYVIDFRREHSHFFKALHISYPSPADLRRSSALHLSAGGDIFIHGEPNRPTKPLDYYKTRDWTNGCIALSDEDLQDVWERTAGPTHVQIVP